MMKKIEDRIHITLDSEGKKIFGVLHLPVENEKAPCVIVCHGLAGHKTGKYRAYVDLAHQLAQEGIATLRFDCRGCGDSEGHFHETTPESHYYDAEVGLKYLLEHPKIDSKRIGVFGRSFGGPVAIKTASRLNTFKTMVFWCPMYSGVQWQDQWQLVKSGAVDETTKTEMMQINGQQCSFEFFEQFFSIDVGQDLEQLSHIPMLHIHGEIDTRITIQHAIEYEQRRHSANAETRFIRLPNSDHEFSHRKERLEALEITKQWFSKTL